MSREDDLTGLRGGRDLMKSSITSWALFFNLGGMSPFTCRTTMGKTDRTQVRGVKG